ncbi:MAG: pyridoxal-phosphate dependent enzyme [Bacteroidales bacterium]|nr:pyridoxal-phosphate dependent enzyme [Bacteroidales bacterium]
MFLPVSKAQLSQTQQLISPHIHKTPVVTSRMLNQLAQADLFFKCECLQRCGAFKIRGATSAVLSLSLDEQAKGVVTHSSGNFAQALACASTALNIKSWIVMPKNAPSAKKMATQGYGGEVVECEPNLKSRETTALSIVERYGATFVHPYNQYTVIRGQATSAMELVAEVSKLDYVLAPVGGGGLISGTALACAHFSPDTKVIGAEPLGADDAFKSFHAGAIVPQTNPQTIADGLRTSLGDLTYPLIKELVSDIITVTEQEIVEAMKLFWSRTKIIIEPSSAVTLAAVLKHPDVFAGKRVGLILSGGNVDLEKFFI